MPDRTTWPRRSVGKDARAPWWALVLAGVMWSLLTGLSLPPIGVWPLALVSVAPLVWAGCRCGTKAWRGALVTGIGTLVFFVPEYLWAYPITEAGYPGMVLYLAAYPTLFVWLVALVRSVDWPVPMSLAAGVLWATVEVLRGEIAFTGFAFNLAAHPLIDAPVLARPAAVLGTYAVSMLIGGLCGSLADAAGWTGLPRTWGGRGALAVGSLWMGLSWLGAWSNSPGVNVPTREVHVAVVQTNVPQSNKMGWTLESKLADFAKFLQLTRAAGVSLPRPDVIVWPETMFPGGALNPEAVAVERSAGLGYRMDPSGAFPDGRMPTTYFHDELVKLQGELKVPMIVGASAADGLRIEERGGRFSRAFDHVYNSALVIDQGKVQSERFNKMVLTPFGEVIPYVWRWPSVQRWVLSLGAAGMEFELSAGTTPRPLKIPLASSGRPEERIIAATPICFEVTRPGACRALMGDDGARTEVILNLSNDGWFTSFDHARQQHLLAARWRCLELGTPMVRSANTGVSCAIDRRGQVIQRGPGTIGPERTEGVVSVSVLTTPNRRPTIYERVGEVPMTTIATLGGAGAIALVARRRKLRALGG